MTDVLIDFDDDENPKQVDITSLPVLEDEVEETIKEEDEEDTKKKKPRTIKQKIAKLKKLIGNDPRPVWNAVYKFETGALSLMQPAGVVLERRQTGEVFQCKLYSTKTNRLLSEQIIAREDMAAGLADMVLDMLESKK